jgi:hypothetical protein
MANNPQSTKKNIQTVLTTSASSNMQSSSEKPFVKQAKKRPFEDAFPVEKIDDSSINDILESLKQRVKQGENRASFKKEFQCIAEYIYS